MILGRLADDTEVDERTADPVLAACERASAPRAALAGDGPRRTPSQTQRAAVVEPPGAFLATVACMVGRFPAVG